jgi:hypothetical protein
MTASAISSRRVVSAIEHRADRDIQEINLELSEAMFKSALCKSVPRARASPVFKNLFARVRRLSFFLSTGAVVLIGTLVSFPRKMARAPY